MQDPCTVYNIYVNEDQWYLEVIYLFGENSKFKGS